MKKLLPKQYAQILLALTKGKKGEELDTAVSVFADFLKRSQSVTLFPYIVRAFQTLEKKEEGIVEGYATTARSISEKEKKDIERALPGAVELEMGIDESLIGGISVRLGNTIVDGSMKSYLTQLKQHLV